MRETGYERMKINEQRLVRKLCSRTLDDNVRGKGPEFSNLLLLWPFRVNTHTMFCMLCLWHWSLFRMYFHCMTIERWIQRKQQNMEKKIKTSTMEIEKKKKQWKHEPHKRRHLCTFLRRTSPLYAKNVWVSCFFLCLSLCVVFFPHWFCWLLGHEQNQTNLTYNGQHIMWRFQHTKRTHTHVLGRQKKTSKKPKPMEKGRDTTSWKGVLCLFDKRFSDNVCTRCVRRVIFFFNRIFW